MIDDPNTSDIAESEVSEILQKKDFGASLRIAREKAALSLTDVAEKLLISVDIIKALENSQADALPAVIFTQGYIRSYAKLLGVSAEDIIDDYTKMVPNSEPALTANSGLPAQKCCNDKVVKFISYGFFIIAIIVFVVWFVNADFKIKSSEKDEVAAFNAQGVDVQLVEKQQEDDQPKEIYSDGSYPNEKLQLNEITESIKTNEAPMAAKSKIIDSETTQSNAENEVPLAADKLSLSALGDSWCEIQDSTGKRLYYQLLNRGEDIELFGVAPFMVFLGNAPKIRVEVNNKIVDFESLINKNSNIASLEISKDAVVISQTNQ